MSERALCCRDVGGRPVPDHSSRDVVERRRRERCAVPESLGDGPRHRQQVFGLEFFVARQVVQATLPLERRPRGFHIGDRNARTTGTPRPPPNETAPDLEEIRIAVALADDLLQRRCRDPHAGAPQRSLDRRRRRSRVEPIYRELTRPGPEGSPHAREAVPNVRGPGENEQEGPLRRHLPAGVQQLPADLHAQRVGFVQQDNERLPTRPGSQDRQPLGESRRTPEDTRRETRDFHSGVRFELALEPDEQGGLPVTARAVQDHFAGGRRAVFQIRDRGLEQLLLGAAPRQVRRQTTGARSERPRGAARFGHARQCRRRPVRRGGKQNRRPGHEYRSRSAAERPVPKPPRPIPPYRPDSLRSFGGPGGPGPVAAAGNGDSAAAPAYL